MKRFRTILCILPLAATLSLALSSCEPRKEGPFEELGETIDDSLDRRPGEEIKDAAEEIGEAVEDLGEAVKDTTN